MQIRELAKSDASTYCALRLRALKEHPTAFSSSYEQTKDRPIEAFARRLSETPGSTDSFLLSVSSTATLSATSDSFDKRNTFIAPSPSWPVIFTAMRLVLGNSNGLVTAETTSEFAQTAAEV